MRRSKVAGARAGGPRAGALAASRLARDRHGRTAAPNRHPFSESAAAARPRLPGPAQPRAGTVGPEPAASVTE